MIIHSPIISGSLTFADGATVTYPEGGVYSGSFSGSYQGDTFTGGVFTGDGSSLTFGGTGIVSSSIQITDGSNIVSSSAQISGYTTFLEKDGDSVISGSSQVLFNDVSNNPFTQGASSVTVSKSIVPSSLTLDLGSSASPFRDLYLSSASLYIDGQQVISSNTSELIITTDTNQSLKLVETGADTITLQSENGDITLTTTGTGNIELDAAIQIGAGHQILSSDGNAIQFGEDINVQGNITVTGTVDSVDVAALKASVDAILSGSSADKDSFAEIVSLINSVDTGNDQAFASFYTSSNQRMGSLESFTSSIDSTIKTKLNADGVISGSTQITITESQISDLDHYTNADSLVYLNSLGVVSGSSQVIGDLDSRYEAIASATNTLISGSSQVVLQDADKTGFTGAGSITTLGTVTSGNVTAILPSGTVSSSAQITITESQISDLVHYNNTDWDNRLATKTTTDLDEGTNLYYTDARVKAKLTAEGVVSGSYVSTTSAQALGSAANVLTLSSTNLILSRGDGSTDTVDLSSFLDDTNTVTSVNTQTGDVVLDADDISDASTTNKFTSAAEISKLAGIEAGATADQTGAEIKSLYEGEANTNAFTDALLSKLNSIEASASADLSATEIKSLYEGNSNTNAFTDSEKSKLGGIEANATADQSASEIKIAYESNSDTNAFTDALLSKLNGIEAGADVVSAASVNAAGAVMNSDTSTIDMSFVIDEDTMVSDLDTKVPTQQSVKAYVDNEITTLIGGAPGALDTLNELAAAINDDSSFASSVTTQLATKADKSITLTAGNGLSGGGDLSANRTFSMSGNYTGTFAVTGGITATADVVAYSSSDKRLKDNIQNIENPIEKVKQLNGVTWDWNDNADELQKSLPNVGVIAQEVEQVLPQLVKDRENGYKGVDYDKLVGLLIEAVKEQQTQIDELKSKLQ